MHTKILNSVCKALVCLQSQNKTGASCLSVCSYPKSDSLKTVFQSGLFSGPLLHQYSVVSETLLFHFTAVSGTLLLRYSIISD